ncbi:MAG: hypothetical protein ACFBSC_04710 [Microcoleaceae cyanobacterium]
MTNCFAAFVTLADPHIEPLVAFYSNVLETQPQIYRPGIYAEFQLECFRLGIFQPRETYVEEFQPAKTIDRVATSGSMSLCLEVKNLEKIMALLSQLGYPVSAEIIHASHGREVYAHDPQGNRLILHETGSHHSALTTQNFDIDQVIELLRDAVQPFPKAAMFQLAEEGFNSLYEQLISCIISIRTYDETSVPVSRRLFAQARTPAQMVELSTAKILELIQDCTFPENKAEQIRQISQQILQEFQGELPPDPQILTEFKGVGPKCAHLALGVALDYPCISVDVHVHRVTNRWGYVATKAPEKTMKALENQLPQQYWVEINRLLVPFGKHICRGNQPKCNSCPLEMMCAQVGVES